MDCDFTHTPADLLKMLAAFPGNDVTVGSRHLRHESLPGWTRWRKLLTGAGHLLTKYLLRMPYDATGAFRVYRLTAIPRGLFDLVRSRGYAFFFESLYVLHRNRFKINEVPIVLPARAAGHSKMSLKEIFRSVRFLFAMGVMIYTNPRRFRFRKD
jgi:dolichol-phosphate mannosyltransferase